MMKNSVFLLSSCLLLKALPVSAACMMDITGVNFGNYDVFETGHLEGVGNVYVSCNPRTAVLITLSTGNSNDYILRQLSYLTHQLNYNLYSNAGMTKILGDGTANTDVLNANNITNRSFNIYGRIPARQNVNVGSYTDNIMVNFYF